MSFSDFAGTSSSSTAAAQRRPGTASGTTTNNKESAAPLSGSLGVISEALLQYQRNVDILQNIVQSLSNMRNTDDTIQQYEAQCHVLQQLEDKVKILIVQQPKSNTPATIKLQRDFQRVQMRSKQLSESATKKISFLKEHQKHQQEQQRQHQAGMFHHGGGSGVNDNDEEILAEQRRIQQQLIMEDRLNEEIMREREEEIRNINKGMHTVNEIYKDLAHIVGQQQDQIDTIETQMEDSRANAESGLQQVEKANEKYGSSNCTIM